MTKYYSDKLSGKRLEECYRIGSPRIQQYLDAEIAMARSEINGADRVLELGCGYGRVMKAVLDERRVIVGIDNALNSLQYALEYLPHTDLWSIACMDVARLAFRDRLFDCVLCLQNGISAFHTDSALLLSEAGRVTRPGGKIILTTYSPAFWDHRLEWFERQAEAGLLGEIDYDKTGDGNIVCRDGFTATTVSVDDFERLALQTNMTADIFEIDGSNLVCRMTVRARQNLERRDLTT